MHKHAYALAPHEKKYQHTPIMLGTDLAYNPHTKLSCRARTWPSILTVCTPWLRRAQSEDVSICSVIVTRNLASKSRNMSAWAALEMCTLASCFACDCMHARTNEVCDTKLFQLIIACTMLL